MTFLEKLSAHLKIGTLEGLVATLEFDLKHLPRWRWMRRRRLQRELLWARTIRAAYGERLNFVMALVAAGQHYRERGIKT